MLVEPRARPLALNFARTTMPGATRAAREAAERAGALNALRRRRRRSRQRSADALGGCGSLLVLGALGALALLALGLSAVFDRPAKVVTVSATVSGPKVEVWTTLTDFDAYGS